MATVECGVVLAAVVWFWDQSMTPYSWGLCFDRSKVGSVMPVDEFPSVEKPGNSTMSQVDGGSDGGSALPAVAPRAAFDEDNPDEESSATAKMSLGTKVKILITFFQVCSVIVVGSGLGDDYVSCNCGDGMAAYVSWMRGCRTSVVVVDVAALVIVVDVAVDVVVVVVVDESNRVRYS